MASGGSGSIESPWTVGVQDPTDPQGLLSRVRLSGECIATSGDYIQAFTQDRRFHHIIDPRTGYSPEKLSSVTVVTSNAMDADALSTAVFVLGPREGIVLLDRLERIEGMLVTKTGELFASRGFPSDSVV